MTRTVARFRLGVVCLALVALAFLQEPGRVAADTKLDLTANPVAFLGRALHMWDASGFFGQVQNQAYGYLWPIGTLFAAMDLAQVVPWTAQRVWWSIVLVTAFLGVVRLSGLLGVRRTAPRVIAGLGYALSVRMISELTTVSAEVWPMALTPWVLVPLVRASQSGGSARQAAALSAMAFALTGAINAVASAAILVAPGLFLLLRCGSRDGRRLLGWWAACTVLACLWWVVPLLLLSRYAPPFLDWIESAAVTTGFNDPTSVLRGASHWIPYLIDPQGPIWPAGWTLVHAALPVLGTGVVTVVGLWGLLRRQIPERAFLVLLLSTGLVLTGLGHISASGLGGPGAAELRALLDGPLAPFRNVHKFQPLVTLPLLIGVAHALDVAWRPALRRAQLRNPKTGWQPVAAGVAVVGIVAAALPAWTGSLVGGRSYLELPEYWRETAQWLNDQDDGRALVVPAASFGVYFWGRTQDEPLQALDTQSWAVRDAVPLSSAGNIRLLDQVERMLGAGSGSAGLATALARSGVRYLVLRNDLEGRATQSALPVLVHQALTGSPGIERVATFGPILASVDTETRLIDRGLRRSYPAVEVFAVAPDARTVGGRVSLRDASTVVEFTGSSEALPDLADSGLLTDQAAVALGDPLPPESAVTSVLTDTYRRSEVNFGAAQRNYGSTLTPTDDFRASRAVHDYLPVEPDGRQAVARLVGARAVSASSAGSNPFALRARAPAAQPWAALDGDPRTAWLSGDLLPGVGQWWEIDLDSAREVTHLEVSLVTDERVGDAPEVVRVSTDSGFTDHQVDVRRTWQRLDLPGGSGTSRIRLELVAVAGGGAGQGFGLSEVRIPGVEVERPIVTVPAAADGGLVLAARSTGRESCATTDTAIICDPLLADPSEDDAGIDRIVDVEAGGEYRVALRLRPRPGSALDAYLAAPEGAVTVRATSQVASDPAVRAQAAADRDPRTTWIASPLDREPRLSVDLGTAQQVSGLQLQTAPDVPASRPLAVEVRLNGVTLSRYVDASGRIDLPDVTTDRLEIRFGATSPVRSVSSGTGATVLLPVGVTELRVLGATDRRMHLDDDLDIPVPCGFAPSVRVDDAEAVVTAADATIGGVLTGALASGASCGGDLVRLTAGEHRIRVAPTAEWTVERVDLVPVDQRAGASAAQDPGRPAVASWGDTGRVVSVPTASSPRLLETTESFNDGWVATLDDQTLTAYRVDGWRQAWLVPAGAGGHVQLSYAPDAGYRMGLAVGLAGLLALVAAALIPARGRRLPPLPASPPRGLLAAVPPAAAVVVGGLWAVVGVAVVGVTFLVVRNRRDVRGAVRAGTAVGLAGISTSLAAQAVWTWPARAQAGWLLEAVLILGPAMALAALGCVVFAGDARAPGSDAPAVAS